MCWVYKPYQIACYKDHIGCVAVLFCAALLSAKVLSSQILISPLVAKKGRNGAKVSARFSFTDCQAEFTLTIE